MKKEEIFFKSSQGESKRFGIIWRCDKNIDIKAILQISHGMCEYINRYEELAEYMTKKGIVICGNDHEGHGKSSKKENYGHIKTNTGYINIAKDMNFFYNIMKSKYKDIPYFILGHSMGSFILRYYIENFDISNISGIIFSGTAYKTFIIKLGLILCNIFSIIKGEKERAVFISNLSNKIFNFSLKSNRTCFDWISNDKNNVDNFINNDKCAFTFTYGGYINLLTVLLKVNNKKWFKNFPDDMPVYIFSGDKDPIGNFGKGPIKIYNKLVENKCKDIKIKLYDGGRHEMLNDLNKYEVFQDLYLWIENHIK